MKTQKVIKIITIVILVAILAESLEKMFIYSKYIFEPAENLIGKYNNKYFSLFDIGEYDEDYITMRFGLLGGNNHLGTLSIKKDTTINIQAKKRHGDLKLLLVDEATEESIYYDYINASNSNLEMKAGDYSIYLVGDWFFGNCTINYNNAEFTK